MPTANARLAPEPRSVAAARRLLRDMLERWDLGDLEFAASQALTEIATNAVLHARTAFDLAIDWDGEVLRVCVADASARMPVQRRHSVEATTGRGLALVETLCRSWGVQVTDQGKQVWFELAKAQQTAGGDPDLDVFDLDAFPDLDDEPRTLHRPDDEASALAGGEVRCAA
jgi:anti-sigma regulatory factor (Ser/Thr protein kinase)